MDKKQDPIERIVDDLKKRDLNISKEDVAKRYNQLTELFHVRPGEAMRSVVNYFLKENGIAPAAKGPLQACKVEDIAYGGMRVSLDAKVAKLLEPKNAAIRQTGFLADATGLIRFTFWAKASKLSELVEGNSYHFDDLASDEYNGKRSVKISKITKISPIANIADAMEYTGSGDTVEGKIDDLKEAGTWANLEVKCVQLWDATSDSIDQSGLVGDETGTMKFTKWTKAKLKTKLEEGKSYRLENVIVDEYNGKLSIKMNKNTVIKPLDRDVEAVYKAIEFVGAIVNISEKSSGLIRRCPQCKAALQKGVCAKHGKVDGLPDLRILAHIDNGEQVMSLLIKREGVEKLLGHNLDELQKMTMEALDPQLVFGMAEAGMLGRYFKATGPLMDDFLVASAVEAI